MIVLTRLEFERLYQALYDKLQSYIEIAGGVMPKNKLQIIGYDLKTRNKGTTKQHSLPELINKNEDVQKYLKAKGKKGIPATTARYLYEKVRAFDNGDESIEFSGHHEFIYFIFLGYTDRTDFFYANPVGVQTEDFTCLYYSRFRKKITSLNVKFQISVKGEFFVTISGFSEFSTREYLGKLERVQDNFLITAKSDHYYLSILFTIKFFSNDLKNLLHESFLTGIITGISARNEPFSATCMLINKKPETGSYNNLELESLRYLNIKRDGIHLDSSQISNSHDDRLPFKSNDIELISHMTGKTYRVITINPESKRYFQSRFTIRNDYSALLITPFRMESECHLSITRYFYPKLLVSSMERDGESLAAFAAIEIPRRSSKEFIKGYYCSIDESFNSLFGNNFLMIEDPSHFDCRELRLSDIKTSNEKPLIDFFEHIKNNN